MVLQPMVARCPVSGRGARWSQRPPFACCLGTAFLAPDLGATLTFVAWRALASLAAASLACARSSGFMAFLFLMSSKDMPTMAFWNFCAFRVRFLACSSALPFLFIRRQAWVQRNFTALILWWKSASAFELMKKLVLPSFATKRWPRPG